MKTAILMLTYNAPQYVLRSILGVRTTKDVAYELIVVDNHSNRLTRMLLRLLKFFGMIDILYLNKTNDLFAKGNNIASRLVSGDLDYYCLLNSNVRINNSNWLEKLHGLMPDGGGISSFGAVLSEPQRADGYCMLINRGLYDKYMLDENYEWWWSVTKLESQILLFRS